MSRVPLVQGDVMLFPVDDTTVPTAPIAARDVRNLIVLGLGEVTGHAHVIADADVTLYQETADAVDRWLRVGQAGATFSHVLSDGSTRADHHAIPIPAGLYRVIQQVEYQPGPVPRRIVAD